jgi:hypothetical protein
MSPLYSSFNYSFGEGDGTPRIVTNGLVLNLDVGRPNSYNGGTTWRDLSGNGNTGTLVNGVGYVGTNGGSLSFDGVDDYATINDSNSLDLTTALTLSLWFNRGDILTLAPGDQHNLFIKGSTAAPGGDQVNYTITLFGPTGGGFYYWVHPTTGARSSLTPPSQIFFANQWYNIVITHVSGSTPIPYLNGVQKTDWTASNPTTALVANTYRATICGDVERGSNMAATFNGRMSNISVYNRALSAAEVKQNYDVFKGRYGI